MSTFSEKPSTSKPGRKLLTTEPKNKRTAQNRAAQRAFRERKERKLQELEDKVSQLEQEKSAIASESDLLRMQVKSLMDQLNSYKNKTATTNSSGSSPAGVSDTHRSISSASSIVDNWKTDNYLDDYKGDFKSENYLGDLLQQQQQQQQLQQPKGDYNEDVFCKSLNEVCGTKECPLPKASSADSSNTATSSIKASPLMFHTNSSHTTTSPFDKLATSTINSNLDDENLNGADDMGFLFDQGNTVMFENIPDTDILKNVNLNLDMYNDLDLDFNAVVNPPQGSTKQLPQDPSDPLDQLLKQDSLLVNPVDTLPIKTETPKSTQNSSASQIANEVLGNAADEMVPNNDMTLMKCSQIWERVTAHPKFTDIDIDGLCEELKQKAKCSEKGVVVNGADVGDILKTAVKQQQQLKRQQQQQQQLKTTDNMFLGSTW